MIHLIYRTTCLVTGKWYVGMHSAKKIEDGYLGSGVILRRSIKKHGAKNHVREILEEVPDRASLFRREAEIVTEDLLKNPMCMNTKLGGHGGFDHLTVEHRRKSHATVKALRASDPEYRARHSARLAESARKADKTRLSEVLKERYKDPEFAERQRQSLIKANIGLRRMTDPNGQRRKIHLSEIPLKLTLGWTSGWRML